MSPQFASALVVALALTVPTPVSADPTAARQDALVHLIRHDCGSCHGMTLKGGLGPPLLPANLSEIPDDALADTILMGRQDSPMPPWHPFLTQGEAQWMARTLKRGLGK